MGQNGSAKLAKPPTRKNLREILAWSPYKLVIIQKSSFNCKGDLNMDGENSCS